MGLGIVAYRDGGATAVGLVGLLRMVPSAILAPLLSPLADRGRRERVLILVSVLRGVATGAAAVVVGVGGPTSIVYALAVLSTIAATLYRPAHSALLPSLCHSGYELASANVVRGLLDSAATLVGPLLAALLLQLTGVTVVFAVAAGASLWAAALLVRLRYDAPPRPPAPVETNLIGAAAEGIRAVSGNRDIALIMGLAAAQAFTRGALTVLTVVVAIDVLGTGEPGVGVLTAAIGAGAVLGSSARPCWSSTRRLGAWFAVGVALWGIPVTLIGVFPQQAAALGLLACVGVGNSLIDLGGFTLLARLASDDVLARVFGVLESLVALFIGVGAIVTSLLIGLSGVRPRWWSSGCCARSALVSWPRLRRMDRSIDVRDRDIATLQSVAMLERTAAARHRAARPRAGTGRGARRARGLPPGGRRRPLLRDRVGRGRGHRGRTRRRQARPGGGVRRDRAAAAHPSDGDGARHQRAPTPGAALRPLPARRARLHAERARGRLGRRLDARPLHAAATRGIAP